ncbi:MAG: hypothetical protein IPI00_13565 [Flavobacteriales bacterium]|nr:hypothetical protein [Flavobacteriales bacterium]MBK6944690.1 hypothetical protein [Flavobacteriales bacterium]MBK7241162.1 hypothetical protein [Flavobacteriales bacterium]MBP9137232.1 hypothetical protein [Flavobacteriales bacterium]HQV50864.1 hypothetical protein [Flavobacteriales bacterium]
MENLLTTKVAILLCIGMVVLILTIWCLNRVLKKNNTYIVHPEKTIVSIYERSPNGVSSPWTEAIASAIINTSVDSLSKTLKAVIKSDSKSYQAQYQFKASREKIYYNTGPIVKLSRLDERINELKRQIEEKIKFEATADKSAFELDAQDPGAVDQFNSIKELDLPTLKGELESNIAFRQYHTPFDKSIVGLIELKRVILNNDTQIVACTIKLIPVSNMEGTLTKFKLWSVQFDYLKCRLDVWHRYFDVDMLITLKTVIRDSTGVYRQALLLQDMISLAGIRMGKLYGHDELSHIETHWFQAIPQMSNTVISMEGQPDRTVLDSGNFTIVVDVTERKSRAGLTN